MEQKLLFVIVAISIIHQTFAARRVDATARATQTLHKRMLRDLSGRTSRSASEFSTTEELLELGRGEQMVVTREAKSAQGTTLQKLQETYMGVPVYGSTVVVSRDEEHKLTGDATGEFVEGIEDDLTDVELQMAPTEALNILISNEGDEFYRKDIHRVQTTHYVYVDDENDKDKEVEARSVYLVSYFLRDKRPTMIVDTKTHEVIKRWDNIGQWDCGGTKQYKGVGGNEKVGEFRYGNSPFCLQPTIVGDRCIMENQYVRVIDMHQGTDDSRNETASFRCKNGYNDEVNGAYSPVLDAFFAGTAVGKMFEEWFHSTPLREKVVLRVHYDMNMENAFWDGRYCSFGDGSSYFYPLTSFDVVGHEIGHGVTEQASGLEYREESGGLNEAFSDIIGEATEEYIGAKGGSDMFVGLHITKDEIMRYFRDPMEDGRSPGHVDGFTRGMDPHYSSGVFRRMFYVIIKQKGAGIRPVAHALLHANRMYWGTRTGFVDAGCGVMKAAYDLGQNPTPYWRALDDVGIKEEQCDVSGHVRHLRDGNPVGGITANQDVHPLFGFEVPEDTDSVSIEAISQDGRVNITVRVGTWMNDAEARSDLELFATGVNTLSVTGVSEGDVLYIELSTAESTDLTGITVTASANHDSTRSLGLSHAYWAKVFARARSQ